SGGKKGRSGCGPRRCQRSRRYRSLVRVADDATGAARSRRSLEGGGATINSMELAIRIQVEELPEGLFLATSVELPGLVAQGRTVAEALDIARDVARKLVEARREREGIPDLPTTTECREYTIVVAA